MAIQRLERKKAEDPNYRTVQTKARAAWKTEVREKFLHAILHAFRDTIQKNGVWGGSATVLRQDNAPLVYVESTKGRFSKHNISIARTVTRKRRGMERGRSGRRRERARSGRSGRAEKQEGIGMGISGFVDRLWNGRTLCGLFTVGNLAWRRIVDVVSLLS